MGFDVQGTRFLLSAYRSGVRFTRTAVLGRQELFLSPRVLRRILQHAGLPRTSDDVHQLLTSEDGYAEPLLRLLGAEHIDSVDASSYEGSSIVHDMNLPIPDNLCAAFSPSSTQAPSSISSIFQRPSGTAWKWCSQAVISS